MNNEKIKDELNNKFIKFKDDITELDNKLFTKKIDLKEYKLFIKINKNKLIDSIKQQTYPKVMEDNDNVLIYYDNYYHSKGDITIRTICGFVLGISYSDAIYKDILNRIKATCTIKREDFGEVGEYINLNNGVYDIKNKKLVEHSKKYNFQYKFTVDYNDDISCEIIENYIKESTSSENDSLCLQEFIGFCLYPTYNLNDLDKFILLYGATGHNRKSKTCSLIRELLGSSNISSVDLDSLSDDRFSSADLYGKKANIADDIPSTIIRNTSMIKKLIGGGQLTVERKYENQFQFINNAKLVFSCNTLPEIIDTAEAWWTKVIMLELCTNFREHTTLINEKMLSEGELFNLIKTPENMQKVLKYAITGLHRLIDNKKFTYDHNTTKTRWEKDETVYNPIEEFLTTCISKENGNHLTKRETFDAYLSFMESYEHPQKIGIRVFAKYMKEFGIKDGITSKKDLNGKQPRVWKNIKLNEEYIKLVSEGKLKTNEIVAEDD